MYMCKVFLSNRQKLKNRKCYSHKVSSALLQAYRRIANDVIRFVTQANKLVKVMLLNKGVKLKFHALLAKTRKNSQIC